MPQLGQLSRLRTPEVRGGIGPISFDPAIDSAYDALILADLPGYGSYWKFTEKSGLTAFDRGQMRLHATFANFGSMGLNAYPGPIPAAADNISVRYMRSPGTNCTLPFSMPDMHRYPGIAPCTLEAWIYPLIARDGVGIFDHQVGATGSGWRFVHTAVNRVFFQRVDATGAGATINTAVGSVPNETWTHVVATYDSVNMRVYVNGVLSAGPFASSHLMSATDNSRLVIGNASGLGQAFDGYIARPAIYSTALSAAQILVHFQAGVATSWSPIVESNRLKLTPGFGPQARLQIPFAPPGLADRFLALPTAIETDLALDFGRFKSKDLAQAMETDLALVLGREKSKSISVAIETDLAQPFGRLKNKPLPIASETDLAQVFGRVKTLAIATALESDVALAFGRFKTKLLPIVTESDIAMVFGGAAVAVKRFTWGLMQSVRRPRRGGWYRRGP